MSFDADAIVDRRRMRRKLTFWRVTAILVVLVAVVGAGFLLVPYVLWVAFATVLNFTIWRLNAG